MRYLHTMIRVRDLEAAVRFFCEGLGLREVRRRDHERCITVRCDAMNGMLPSEIVKQLQSMGLRAVRADSPAPADRNVLIVQGSFETIDAGNRRRRILVGLGAGKSQVGTSVQLVYQPAGETPRLIQSFDANADSGKAPGVAETAGVGAAAGHVATSAAAGVGLHGVAVAALAAGYRLRHQDPHLGYVNPSGPPAAEPGGAADGVHE